MKRFYSLFVTCDELLSSPYVHHFSDIHDITLTRGRVEVVNFLLQYPISKEAEKELEVIYEPELLQLNSVAIESFKHQTLITVSLVPLEIGSMRIGFSFPYSLQTLQHSYLPIKKHLPQRRKTPLTRIRV